MALDERKTLLLKRSSEESSCIPLCDYVIHYTAVQPVSRRLSDGSMMFTGGETDGDVADINTLRPDSLAFEGISAGFTHETEMLTGKGRILAPLSDPLLGELKASCSAKILTFDMEDADANFFAQNIKKSPSGYTFELVYRPSADLGSRMINRFIPGYDKNLFVGVSIGSSDLNDVLNSVIAFGCVSLMGIEPHHVRTALQRYAFPSRPKEIRQEITREDILGMREFEED